MVVISDPIGDMLTRIRNGYLAGRKSISAPYSKAKEAVLKVLKDKEIIIDFKIDKLSEFKTEIIINLHKDRLRVLEIKRVSKPGRRVYSSFKHFVTVKGDKGILLVSTSQGVMDSVKAKKLKIGGEVIAEIF
jgi:small subunit ribosomal protein S8